MSRHRNRSQSSPVEAPAWLSLLNQPRDIASIVVFRIGLGLLLLVEVFRFFWNRWIEYYFLIPRFHFKYPGFGWVEPLPGAGMSVCFTIMGIAAILVMFGWWYRVATVVLWLGWTYVLLLERAAYLNHLYLISLITFLMIFLPAHRSHSVDARQHPRLQSDVVPAWALWLLRIQIGIPYVYGAIAKLNGDWLRGEPMHLWASRMKHVQEYLPGFGNSEWGLALAWGGFLLDLLVVPALFWKPTRPFALVAALLFHAFNAIMFHIGIFPFLMMVATTLFLPPSWPRRWVPSFRVKPESKPADPTVPAPLSRGVLSFWLVYLVLQLLVPFRHFLYAGDVDWTQEGYHFSWRMMLNDRTNLMQIVVEDPQSGRRFSPDLSKILTPLQVNKMGDDPEMLRQFAVWYADSLRQLGLRNPEIRVIALCSLNGRKPQLLIDPQTDLSKQPDRWTAQPWIVPLTEPLPEEPFQVPPSRWSEVIEIPEFSAASQGTQSAG